MFVCLSVVEIIMKAECKDGCQARKRVVTFGFKFNTWNNQAVPAGGPKRLVGDVRGH